MHRPVFRKTVGALEEKSGWKATTPNAELDALKFKAEPNASRMVHDLEKFNVLKETSALGGPNALWGKSDDPQTAAMFDGHSERLRIAMGLLERLAQYASRRGYGQCVDSKFFLLSVQRIFLTPASKLSAVSP